MRWAWACASSEGAEVSAWAKRLSQEEVGERQEEGRWGAQIDTREPQGAPQQGPQVVALTAPHPNSESGKDTVLKALLASLPEMLGQSPHKESGPGVI